MISQVRELVESADDGRVMTEGVKTVILGKPNAGKSSLMKMCIRDRLILTFFALAYYCVKGYNLMIGFLIISVLWTVLSLAGAGISSPEFIAENPVLQFGGDGGKGLVAILNKIYQAAPEGWGTTLVNVCWGAWFGRVLMETGIASTLIRKTVELGGDRPIITIVLLNIVTAFIFTAMMLSLIHILTNSLIPPS